MDKVAQMDVFKMTELTVRSGSGEDGERATVYAGGRKLRVTG